MLVLIQPPRGTSSPRLFFFFNDTATTEIYTLSLHDALPISSAASVPGASWRCSVAASAVGDRSEEHTSELQSHHDLVCRLLLEKKTKIHLLGAQANPQHTVRCDLFAHTLD